MAKILIAGSSGFIGKRLIYRLLEEGHEVVALSRLRGVEFKYPKEAKLKLLFGDLRNFSTVDPFPEDIDAAYYLVHAMGAVVQNLEDEEVGVAKNFVSAVEKTHCKQIIFLSGIIEDEKKLSPHLRSRLSVENVLKNGPIPCTVLRSSIIIGEGSASFEIIRDLVEKLPLMVAPKWVENLCQPIAVGDVLFYLSRILLNEASFHKTYDIGGPEVLSFKDVLLRYARFRGLKRYIFDVPVLTPKLSSYWLVFITSVKFSICSYLVESMKQNTRKLNKKIDELIPYTCLSYEKALEVTLQKIAQNEVVSTWMDAWDLKSRKLGIEEFIELPVEGCLKDEQVVPIKSSPEQVLSKIWSIGGKNGWYAMDWAWRFRGLVDQFLGGTGLNRGRRDDREIVVGDSIDFWRVLVANKEKKQLILYAEMKIPGEAWLEFKIDEKNNLLKQTALFRPKGFLGRLYWYLLLPIHLYIFKKMASTICQK